MAAEGVRARRLRRRIGARALVAAGVVAALVAAGVFWFGRGGSGASYRTATVTRASVAQTLTSVGTVSSAHKFSAAFPVAGTVASVSVQLGQHVAAGQRLARLDTTSLAQQVDTAVDTVNSDKQALADARDGQLSASQEQSSVEGNSGGSGGSGGGGLHADAATAVPLTSATHSPTPSASTSPSASATPSASGTPSSSATPPRSTAPKSGGSVSELQQQVIAQQQRIDADLLTLRGPDGTGGQLAQANACTADAGADCSTLLQQVATLENTIAGEQAAQQQYEAALNQAIAAAQSSSGTGAGSSKSGSKPGSGSKSGASVGTPHSGFSGSGSGSGSTQRRGAGTSGRNGQGSSPAAASTAEPVSAAQLAAYQVHVDAARAELTLARQNLAAATLTSPLSGTVADVSMSAGDRVGAGSSTEMITVIGPGAELVGTTVALADVDLVKVGQSARVHVDGVSTTLTGTVSRIGVLNTTTGSSTSFPVTVQLAADSPHVLDGVSADVTITVATARDVLTVPTSAVHALGALHTVTVLQAGKSEVVRVGVGAMGAIRTQITAGLSAGQQVVLADLDEPLPTNDTTGRGFGAGGLARAGIGAGRLGGGPGGVTPNRRGN